MKKIILFIILLMSFSDVLFSQSFRFRPGFYYVLADRLNVRSEPNLSGSVIGQLRVNSRIEILAHVFNEQIINDVSAYWYRIRFNNTYGFVWGGFIAAETFVFDIDNNGINDYFHYRISGLCYFGRPVINGHSDVFIYINNELIPINFGVYYKIFNNIVYNHMWQSCRISEGKNSRFDWNGVIIYFYTGEGYVAYFGIAPNGEYSILAYYWR